MLIYGVNFPEGKMSDTTREYAANYRQLPLHTCFKKGRSGNPRGRPAKNLPALLAAALNEKVTVTENGKRRQVTKREAVINKSASAELRATEMLIDMLRDIEKKAEPAMADKNPVQPDRQGGGPTNDRQDAPQHVQRLSLGSATGWCRSVACTGGVSHRRSLAFERAVITPAQPSSAAKSSFTRKTACSAWVRSQRAER
jgi:hypothetical protein